MEHEPSPNLLAVVGHTAAGKTALAVRLARALGGELVSADSRQVYRGMDIGTGKDLGEYLLDGRPLPYHLIDIREAGQKYDLFHFVQDFAAVWEQLRQRGSLPVLCGGSGLYLDAVLSAYQLRAVPRDPELRARLESLDQRQLVELYESMRLPHNHTDYDSRQRLLRAIEIAHHEKEQTGRAEAPRVRPLVLGMRLDRDARRESIARRLRHRLENGLVEEVEGLLRQGVSAEDLIYYGLEYKFAALHLAGQMDRGQMESRLRVAIQQFAKRQMTWFRKMEREGMPIHWLDAARPLDENLAQALDLWRAATRTP